MLPAYRGNCPNPLGSCMCPDVPYVAVTDCCASENRDRVAPFTAARRGSARQGCSSGAGGCQSLLASCTQTPTLVCRASASACTTPPTRAKGHPRVIQVGGVRGLAPVHARWCMPALTQDYPTLSRLLKSTRHYRTTIQPKWFWSPLRPPPTFSCATHARAPAGADRWRRQLPGLP